MKKCLLPHKDMKIVRLKVFSNPKKIKLSVPKGTPEDWIKDFLSQKQKWIEMKVDLFRNTTAIEKEKHIRSGSSTRILGRQMIIQIEEAGQKGIQCEHSKLILYTLNNSSQSELISNLMTGGKK